MMVDAMILSAMASVALIEYGTCAENREFNITYPRMVFGEDGPQNARVVH